MPVVIDSRSKQRQAMAAAVERHRDEIRRAYENLLRLSVWVDDDKEDPTNTLARLGTPMTNVELEARIRKMAPNLLFENHPENKARKAVISFASQAGIPHSWMTPKRCAYLVKPSGEKQFLFAFEAGIMPEYSILRRISRLSWNGKTTHIERADLKGSTPPGMRVLNLPWREEVRGWRTVLLRLVECGILTLEQVESSFGPGKTRSWASKLGKRSRAEGTPW